MIKLAIETIQRVKEELGEMPEEVARIIHFLNNKNRYELQELEIEDRTETILEVRKVLSKRKLMLNLEEKCENMLVVVDRLNKDGYISHPKGKRRISRDARRWHQNHPIP